MSKPCWRTLLLTILQKNVEASGRTALVGVGHELRGDDAVGLFVARALSSCECASLLVLEAGSAPENFTGSLRDYAPDLVLFVDAVYSGGAPGSVHVLRCEQIAHTGGSTHTLSLHLLAAYLEAELGCEVWLLGIEAGQDRLGSSDLSPAVRRAERRLVRAVRAGLQDQQERL